MTCASSLPRLSLAAECREGSGKEAATPRPQAGANPEKPRDDPGSEVREGGVSLL